jgi:transglutaminase-like putative cysteine protease
LFLPENTVAVAVPPRVKGGLDIGRQIELSQGLDVRYRDADGLGLTYSAFVDEEIPPDILTTEERSAYLEVPPGQERLGALTDDVIRGASSAEERVQWILRYLRDSDELRYSLDQPAVGDRDPLEVFVFEAKAGHCEYFSTAMAVMSRLAGLPSRNVTGFVGGRFNSYGRYYSLRQGDAHSWVEVYIDGRGWVTHDPTPPLRHSLGPTDGALTGFAAFIDALRVRWATQVVNYDLRAQVGLASDLGRWLRSFGSDDEQPVPRESALRRERPRLRALRIGGVFVAIFVGEVILIIALGSRRRSQGKPRTPEAVRLYRALEKRLQRVGRGRPRDRTPLEHARVLTAEGFVGASTVDLVTARYLAARYGPAPLSSHDRRRLEAEVRRL